MDTQSRPVINTPNISRLITAAVINKPFEQLLLSNPEQAISTGYNGEAFPLNRQEKDLVLSIKANTLADFASSLSRGIINENPVRINYYTPFYI